jgi:hypothetical protein
MKNPPRPAPVWLKWLLRSVGIIMILGSLYLMVLVVIALIGAFHVYLGPKGHAASDQQWMTIFGGLLGRLVGQIVMLLIGLWLVRWPGKKKSGTGEASPPASAPITDSAASTAPPAPAMPAMPGRVRNKRWSACNILHTAEDAHRLWQFNAKGGGFVLDREHRAAPGQPLPPRFVAKSWSSLWQPRLNVAWLPPESVFLRVIELPQSPFEETLAMVELQMEKLAPMPVAQVVWTIHVLPQAGGELQTVVVVIAARSAVEEFLGKLEGRGYLADRLETPFLDQLEAHASARPEAAAEAWVYAGTHGKDSALLAWRSGGVLRNLSFVALPPDGDRAKSLQEQLAQLSWAGEMEGWLTEPPKWHLVADPVTAADWEKLLHAAVNEPVAATPPLPPAELAARTAVRAAGTAPGAALLPAEFATRYHQQFVDRLWLRGLLATGVLYAVGVVIYFCATTVLGYKTRAVEQQAAQLAGSYTNVLELKARYGILKERETLKFAALDCWKIVAENLPEGLTLQRSSFDNGQKLTLSGVCSQDQIGLISDPGKFYDSVRKAKMNGEDMFEPAAVEPLIWNQNGKNVAWHFTLELRNKETKEVRR